MARYTKLQEIQKDIYEVEVMENQLSSEEVSKKMNLAYAKYLRYFDPQENIGSILSYTSKQQEKLLQNKNEFIKNFNLFR